jgi:hypothetical protein
VCDLAWSFPPLSEAMHAMGRFFFFFSHHGRKPQNRYTFSNREASSFRSKRKDPRNNAIAVVLLLPGTSASTFSCTCTTQQ